MRPREVKEPAQGHRANRWKDRIYSRYLGCSIFHTRFLPGLLGCKSRAAGGHLTTPKSLSENEGHENSELRGRERQTADILITWTQLCQKITHLDFLVTWADGDSFP